MDDPDAIWKPGYEGPPPLAAPVREIPDRESSGHHRTSDAPPPNDPGDDRSADPTADRSRRRWPWIAIVAAAVAAAALGLTRPDRAGEADTAALPDSGSVSPNPVVVRAIDPPDPSVFGGPAGRRLPRGAAPLWSTEVVVAGDHRVEVAGRTVVVIAARAGDSAQSGADAVTTSVVALDDATGEPLWTRNLDAGPDHVALLGAADGVIVFEVTGATGSLVGLDAETGDTRWAVDVSPNGGSTALVGTPLVAGPAATSTGLTPLIDARSGAEVGRIAPAEQGVDRTPSWTTDGLGTWYVAGGWDLSAYDLTDGFDEPVLVATIDDPSVPRAVVGGRLVTVDGSGSLGFVGVSGAEPVRVAPEVPGPVRWLAGVTDSMLVVSSPDAIAGVRVDGDRAVVDWIRDEGAVVDVHPVVGGAVLEVATEGGAAVELVDAQTGGTVEYLTMMQGALPALDVAGDGVVVLRSSGSGPMLTALDLDGSQRWSIPGAAPVAIGDGLVLQVTTVGTIDGATDGATTPARLRIAASGDVR